jgi:hydrogenase maturation factor
MRQAEQAPDRRRLQLSRAITDFETPDIPANTALSCIQHSIDTGDMRMLHSGTAVRLINANQVQFRNSYAATISGYGVEILDVGQIMRNIDLDLHCEAQPGLLANVVFNRLSSGTTKIIGFRLCDHRVHGAIAVMAAGANVATCRLSAADIYVGDAISAPTAGLFSPSGRFIVTGRIANGGVSALNCTLNGELDVSEESYATAANGTLPGAGSYDVIDQSAVRHSIGEVAVHGAAPHTSHTTDVVLTAADSGKSYDNSGATALVTFTLPAAVKGMLFGPFTCLDADGLKIQAGEASDIIRGVTPAGAALASSAGGSFTTTVIGAFIELEALSANLWQARRIGGTWTSA